MNYPKSFFLIIIFSITIPFISYSADNSPEQKALLEAAAKAGAKAALAAQASQRSYTKLFFCSACIGGIGYGLYYRPWASNADIEKLQKKAKTAITNQFNAVSNIANKQFDSLNHQAVAIQEEVQQLDGGISSLAEEATNHFTTQQERMAKQSATDTENFTAQQKLLKDGHAAHIAQFKGIQEEHHSKWLKIKQKQSSIDEKCKKNTILQELQSSFLRNSLSKTTQEQEKTRSEIKIVREQTASLTKTVKEINQTANNILGQMTPFQEEVKGWDDSTKTSRDLIKSMAGN